MTITPALHQRATQFATKFTQLLARSIDADFSATEVNAGSEWAFGRILARLFDRNPRHGAVGGGVLGVAAPGDGEQERHHQQ
jgi:hypothetical protein